MENKKDKARTFLSILLSLSSAAGALADGALRSADLATQRPSWQAVIGGEAVAQIAETSFGFCVPSDGRMVSACTYSGNVIWQKSVKGKPSGQFSSWNDFVIAVTDRTKLNFINPSGRTLWTRDCGFEIKTPPFPGRDGRIFVQGEASVSCYGLEGMLKWTRELSSLSSLPSQEFPDGSLLIFLSQLDDGKTAGIRISPFGEILEKITFAGQIASAASCSDGVLMSFTDGSAGLCQVNGGDAQSRWVIHSAQNAFRLIISGSSSSAFLSSSLSGEGQVSIIENSTGRQISAFSLGPLDSKDIRYARPTAQGFFASDSSRALEFSSDGTVYWEARLPQKSRWDFIKYTDRSQVLLCMKDWTLNAYTMSQSVGNGHQIKSLARSYTKASPSAQKYDGTTYISPPLPRMEEIRDTFNQGRYSEKEKDMLSELEETAEEYISELTSDASSRRERKSYFSSNPVYTQAFIQAMSSSQTDTFTSSIAQMLELEKDPLILNILIREAGSQGYDGNGEILGSFMMIAERLTKKDTTMSKILCDSTYKIVAFMGRPALYRQGKQILTQLMFPQYPKETRDYARQTLEKIISLEL